MTERLSETLTAQWRREQFNIIMNGPDGWVSVDGIVLAEAPSLGLHIGTTHHVDVTHIPSGRRVGDFETLGAAMEFVHRIAYLTDWTDVLPSLNGAEPQLRETLNTLRAAEQRPRRIAL